MLLSPEQMDQLFMNSKLTRDAGKTLASTFLIMIHEMMTDDLILLLPRPAISLLISGNTMSLTMLE